MTKRNVAMHVAKIGRRYKGKTYESYYLRRTYRDGKHVRHITVANISNLPLNIIEMIRDSLRGGTYVPAEKTFQICRSLPHGHAAAVIGTVRKIELDKLISSRPSRERDLVIAMIAERIIEPQSKLATARCLREETATTSLGQILGVEDADEDELYEAMDWLLSRQQRIEMKLGKKHLRNGTLVLYDVSSSTYTGNHCELAEFGHSKKGNKKGFPQIKYGLLCNADGCPVAIEVFKGNLSDTLTFKKQIRKIRIRFGLKRVVAVGDRGTITSARIRDDLDSDDGLDWITALRAPAIRKLAEQKNIQMSLFDRRDIAEITSPDYPGERLIVCRNPLLANERADKRDKLIRATEKELDKIVLAAHRNKRPLRKKDKIGLRVGRVINRFKVAKLFNLTITDTSFTYERNQKKIDEEAALDGIYVIRTSVKLAAMNAEKTVNRYKDLAKVERAFRCIKTVDLNIEPFRHRVADRVRAHVFICMLAYYVEWHMRQKLSPILFEDDDKEQAKALRESIVAPAQRSPKANRKASRKRTEDGRRVHSFQTSLADLATIAKNRVRINDQISAEFEQLTTATPLQQYIFELLEVPISV